MEIVGSILAVDFGSVHTRVVLIDSVEGRYRLVVRGETRTTDGYPANDIMVGFERVLRDLTDATGRRFLTDSKQVITPEGRDRSGVDMFAVTASIGRPLRAVVVGLVPEVSIASAIRAASGTYIQIAETIHVEDGRSEEERLNAILLSNPDVILLAGGMEHGARSSVLNLADLVKLAVSQVEPNRRPTVIYSGNSQIAEDVALRFDSTTNLLIADNVRPGLRQETYDSARLQLGKAFNRYKETRSASFGQLGSMSQTGVLPTGQSYAVLAEYLGKTLYKNVALIDVGSSASVAALSIKGRIATSIRTDIGLGHSAGEFVENTANLSAIMDWLPFTVPTKELINYGLNKSLRPGTVPHSLRDLHIEHAMLKAGIRNLLETAMLEWESVPMDAIIGAGAALTGTGNPGYDALLLIDALQPIGVTVLQNDPYGLIAAMGAIALHTPEAVVQLLEEEALQPLGTVISLEGQPRPEKPVAQVTVRLESGEVIEETVIGGHLWTLNLATYERATVDIKCQAGLTVNGSRRLKTQVMGGAAGLVIDARGRPLRFTLMQRTEMMPAWISEMTGDPALAIPPDWIQGDEQPDLEALLTETPEQQAGKAEKPRKEKRGRRGRRQQADAVPNADGLDDLFKPDEDDIDELRNVLS
ncbi:MAG: glutamate mutase L [Anaerolineae bacterium]